MSDPRPPAKAGYQRTFPGLIGALVVVVLVVLGWSVFREVTSDKETVPVRTVEWQPVVEVAGDSGVLAVLAPPALPDGWRATSARFSEGSEHLHLGLLTDTGKYVGLEESSGLLPDLVEQYVAEDAEPGKDLTIDGVTWQSWTDASGDYAVGRVAQEGTARQTSYLVVGSAGAETVREFAASLAPVR